MPLALDELVEQPILVNQRAQDLSWEELLYEYERALDDAVALLNGLSEGQIHFKPAAAVFSIAEVLTHSAEADRLFWSWVRLLMSGRRTAIDLAALIPGGGARNDLTLDWVYGEIEACRTIARDTIETLSDPIDLKSTAPHPYFGKLNAKGWSYFMTVHHSIHLRQCEAVVDAPGFPRSASVQTQPRAAYQPSDRKTWLRKKPKSHKGNAKIGTKKQPASKKKTAARSK